MALLYLLSQAHFMVPPVGAQEAPSVDSLSDSLTFAFEPRALEMMRALGVEDNLWPCPDAMESIADCARGRQGLVIRKNGIPGMPLDLWGVGQLRAVAYLGAGFPFGSLSPSGMAGVAPPRFVNPLKSGGEITELTEAWRPRAPLDTPVTDMHWERGALGLNLFHLQLSRMLTTRSYLDFDYYSNSTDETFDLYDYSFQIHQPYLSGWGFLGELYAPIDRDSASLVLQGRAPDVSTSHIRPRIGFWPDTNIVVEAYMDWYRNRTPFVWPYGEQNDSIQLNVPGHFSSTVLGLKSGGIWGRHAFTAEALHGTVEDGAPYLDSLSGGEERDGIFDRVELGWGTDALWGNPTVSLGAENHLWKGRFHFSPDTGSPVEEGWSDAQFFGLRLRPDILGHLDLDAEIIRRSLIADSEHFLGRAGAGWSSPSTRWGQLDVGVGQERRLPEMPDLFEWSPQRRRYPNPHVDPETERHVLFRGLLGSRRLGVRGGFRAAWLQDAIVPALPPSPLYCDELAEGVHQRFPGFDCQVTSVADSMVFRLDNFASRKKWTAFWGFTVALGNWYLEFTHSHLLIDKLSDARLARSLDLYLLPDIIHTGGLGWNKALLDGKLLTGVRWDWEWFSPRETWTSRPPGTGTPPEIEQMRLDEYLVLDFTAHMRIQSFLLYFKMANKNHDYYWREPGEHPPGVNFRFGVDWMLRN